MTFQFLARIAGLLLVWLAVMLALAGVLDLMAPPTGGVIVLFVIGIIVLAYREDA